MPSQGARRIVGPMSEIGKPEPHVIRFGDGAKRCAERERIRQEARRRYLDHLIPVLAEVDQLGPLADRAVA